MRKLLLLPFLPLLLWAFTWDYKHDFLLHKDEIASIVVIKRSDNSKRVLSLRWTLYQNKRLVLLVKYDDFPTQYIIQKEYKRNSIKIALRDDYAEGSKRSFLILKFKDFDASKKRALIQAFILDREKRVDIEFRDPKKSKG